MSSEAIGQQKTSLFIGNFSVFMDSEVGGIKKKKHDMKTRIDLVVGSF